MNKDLSSYYSTVAELLKEEKLMDAHRIFTGGDVSSYVHDQDNWDNDLYAVRIAIDVKTFVQFKLNNNSLIKKLTDQIETAFNDCLRGSGDTVTNVTVVPSSSTTIDERKLSEPSSYWKVGYYKVFISHVSEYKSSASNLKLMLEPYGISAFVAHEDIKPSKEWEVEIEKALFSMNALCAILTPDFNESKWCDQEVGYAFGRNVLCIPIDKGQLPYGIFGKIQALKSDGKNAQQIAERVFNAIIDNNKSRIEYTHTLMNLILNTKDEDLINQWISVLRQINTIEQADLEYFNSHVPDVVRLIDKENLDALNRLFTENGLVEVGVMPVAAVDDGLGDDVELPF